MKHFLLFVTLCFSLGSFAQLQVYTLPVKCNDLVYDAVTDRIYIAIPSTNGSNGNSIGIVNPNTYLLENTVFIGSEPSVLALSDNGQYIYAGFSGASLVRRFDVGTQTAGLQFSLGSDPFLGAFYAEDIEVMPGQPQTIAVSRRNVGFSPRHEGVAIYDNNIMRPNTTPDHTGSNRIEFMTDSSLIGYNNETTEFGLRKMTVNTNGLAVESVTANILNNFYLDFIYHNNYLYSYDGSVIDVSDTPFMIGQFNNATGPVVYDEYDEKACYASYDFDGNITFKRFHPSTFLLADSLPIPQGTGPVGTIITCGEGCYAFNTADDQLIIIKDATLGVDNPIHQELTFYPNPTHDYIQVETALELKTMDLVDLNGRFIKQLPLVANRAYVGDLAHGVYLAIMADAEGNQFTKRLVKQ